MNWMLIVLPSGSEGASWVTIESPADGATSSLSAVSNSPASASSAARASGVLAAATAASRLSTSPWWMDGNAASMAFRRGSIRGSLAPIGWLIGHFPRAVILPIRKCASDGVYPCTGARGNSS